MVSIGQQLRPNGIAARALAAAGIPISAIRLDGGTQSRALLQDSIIAEYAEALNNGVEFPSVIVFYDGADHWLADGFHRVRAYIATGRDRIAADVRQGTRRDAILYSVGANEEHGLRRTNEDKRRAVLTLLNDAEWSKWSDREIGRACRVHHETVGKLRGVTGDFASERTYTTKHGTTAIMNTAAIGKAPPQEKDQQAVELTAGENAPASRRAGVVMFIPEGQDIVALCRHGLAIEAKGTPIEKVTAELGLSTNGYRVSRQIVLLADNADLSAADANTAKEALRLLVETRQWGNAWEVAEPLAIKVWGAGNRTGLLEIIAKRLDKFELSFGIVIQTCVTTNEIDLPYLSADRAKKALQQIGKARGALERFAQSIKEIHE